MKINHLGEICRVPLELKTTVNLPKTDFPMKANLPQNEPKLLEKWEEMGHLRADPEARKGRRSTSCMTVRPTRTAPSTSGTPSTKR